MLQGGELFSCAFSASCHLLSLRFVYSLQHPILRYPQSAKIAVFWACRPDDGGGKHVRNVGQLLREYTARDQASHYCQHANNYIAARNRVLDKLTVAQEV